MGCPSLDSGEGRARAVRAMGPAAAAPAPIHRRAAPRAAERWGPLRRGWRRPSGGCRGKEARGLGASRMRWSATAPLHRRAAPRAAERPASPWLASASGCCRRKEARGPDARGMAVWGDRRPLALQQQLALQSFGEHPHPPNLLCSQSILLFLPFLGFGFHIFVVTDLLKPASSFAPRC